MSRLDPRQVSCVAGWGLALVLSGAWQAHAAPPVRLSVQGSTTVTPIVAEAGELLHHERGWQVVVDTQGGSSGGLAALAAGFVDVAMSSKALTSEDRVKYPHADFRPYPIGLDGVVLAVSAPVWQAGVKKHGYLPLP